MNYPIIEKTNFNSEKTALAFINAIAKLNHHIVTDYGVDDKNNKEPFFVETWNDPFSTKDDLLKKAKII